MTEHQDEPENQPLSDEEIARADEAAADKDRRIMMILAGLVLLGVAVALTLTYWEAEEEKEERVFKAEAPSDDRRDIAKPPKVAFTEVAAESGIDFVHVTGARGRKLLPETMGSGCAFLDYDRDGDPDLFLVNGSPWPGESLDEVCTQRLYRNDKGKFVDVTQEVGLDLTFYGMGAAVGDYNDDGFPDLYVTAVGSNHLFRNMGGRSFEEVTAKAGVGGGDSRWSTSAGFLDHDGDGDLDLLVLNYIKWSPEIDLRQGFQLTGLGRAYGPPTGFEGEFLVLYRNRGDGVFEDVSESAGIRVKNPTTGVPLAKALGIAILDFNADGRPDVLIGNDTVRNFAYRNRGDGSFDEVGVEIGVAYDEKGNARGAMGMAASDFRNDSSLAVAVGNFANEMTALFVNEDPSSPVFYDEATSTGIGAATRNSLTFGVAFLDYDLDGFEDLVCANGHVEPEINKVQRSQHHAQSVDLFWNASGKNPGRLVPVTESQAGPGLLKPVVGRAVATADVDGDGDLDILVTSNGGAVSLFRNDQEGGRSLRLDLRTREGGRSALGSNVKINTSAGVQVRYLSGGTSYLAQSEGILTFGLGADVEARDVMITWPNGTTSSFKTLSAGLHVLAQPSK